MATVTGLTAERMIEMEQATVIDGEVVNDNLILYTRAGTPIDAGNVRGPQGNPGPPISDGNKGDVTVSSGGTNWQLNTGSVGNADLADMPANRFKGAVVPGPPVDLTPDQVVGILPIPTLGAKGVVPVLPATNSPQAYGFLNAAGQWSVATPSFTSKGQLDTLWGNAPNGARAYTTADQVEWIRHGGVWRYGSSDWVQFTPGWGGWFSNPAIGNGIIVGRACRIRNMVATRINIQFGSTTSGGSGQWQLSGLPWWTHANQYQNLLCVGFTANQINWSGMANLIPNSGSMDPHLPAYQDASYLYPVSNADSSNAPGTGHPRVSGNYTFANGSGLSMIGTYECNPS